jgi:hypothetical protein
VLHEKSKTIVEREYVLFEGLDYGFKHLKKGETINGKRFLNDWTMEYLNVCSRTFQRQLKAKRFPDDSKIVPAPKPKAPKTEATGSPLTPLHTGEAEVPEGVMHEYQMRQLVINIVNLILCKIGEDGMVTASDAIEIRQLAAEYDDLDV